MCSTATHSVEFLQINDLDRFKHQIIKALDSINERSGNRYPAPVLYENLRRRVIERGFFSELWLGIDRGKIESGQDVTNSICGLLTIDQFEDEMGKPVCMISRAWCEPGMAARLWPVAKKLIWDWAKSRNCVRIQCQSERDSAWARWLKSDGFQIKETILEVEL